MGTLTTRKLGATVGAEVVGVAVLVERGAAARVAESGLPYRFAYELADLGVS